MKAKKVFGLVLVLVGLYMVIWPVVSVIGFIEATTFSTEDAKEYLQQYSLTARLAMPLLILLSPMCAVGFIAIGIFVVFEEKINLGGKK